MGVFLSLTRQVIFFLPLLFTLPLFLGIGGITNAQPMADIISISITVILVIREGRKPEFRNEKGVFKSIFVKEKADA